MSLNELNRAPWGNINWKLQDALKRLNLKKLLNFSCKLDQSLIWFQKLITYSLSPEVIIQLGDRYFEFLNALQNLKQNNAFYLEKMKFMIFSS